MDKIEKRDLSIVLNKEQIDLWLHTNNIISEKTELYYDFISSLLDVIDETYMGSDFIQTEEDINNHFVWCFNKVTSNFDRERIYFISNNRCTHYEYLRIFYHGAYYLCNIENKKEKLNEYLKQLFNFNIVKRASDIKSFADFYRIFEENLKKTN